MAHCQVRIDTGDMKEVNCLLPASYRYLPLMGIDLADLIEQGGTMALKESPPGLMEVYKWEMLASHCELAIMRSRRLQTVSDRDGLAMDDLVKHLQTGIDGATSVTSANLAAKSEQSILVFQSILNALVDRSPIGERIRTGLEKLKKTALEMAQGKLPQNQDLEALHVFVHRYRVSQQDAIRHKGYSHSGLPRSN